MVSSVNFRIGFFQVEGIDARRIAARVVYIPPVKVVNEDSGHEPMHALSFPGEFNMGITVLVSRPAKKPTFSIDTNLGQNAGNYFGVGYNVLTHLHRGTHGQSLKKTQQKSVCLLFCWLPDFEAERQVVENRAVPRFYA
jgi:hypothetical protein